MSAYDSIALLLTLSALLAYVNYRWVKLPMTIGVMAVGLLLSLGLIALDAAGMDLRTPARTFLAGLHFDKVLMHGMLSYLLFAGALHINLDDLAREKTVVGVMASVGIALSTFLVGTAMYGLTQLVGIEVSYLYCLVFGALISPTDPIAVLGILKTAGTPKSLETKIAGESLFNDGIGVVIFLVLVELATGQEASFGHIVKLFAVEGLGGVALGMVLGLCTYRLLRDVDNYQVEVLLTLALVGGGYALAMKLHTSGPIAVVVAGLFIGNHGRQFAMSAKTREHLDGFWELVDEILNVVLFVLIGLELLVLDFEPIYFGLGLAAIVIVLLARLIAVSSTVTVLRFNRQFSPHVIRILTWGGIRGGISVALALSLPPSSARDWILAVTYQVVIFSILVQGLTIKKVAAAANSTV
ncbi:MAG TPA: sodium:proton antiporter [Lentisphaeria bacterium]|nr:sodium:proton antiporter [Lentisphaeria bacterium]